MKKIAKVAAIAMIACTLTTSTAFASVPSLKGLTYAELTQLKDNINLAMWNSKSWQQVTVPQGIWQIGKDIPAGHWQITAYEKAWRVEVQYGNILNDDHISMLSSTYISKSLTGEKNPYGYDKNINVSSFDIELKAGNYLVIKGGSAIFTPYTGKPSFTFK